MNTFTQLWRNLSRSKRYREEFAAQVKRSIPFQVRSLLKKRGMSQEELANRAGLTQGVVSRAANPDYGNLTLNTLVRIAAGFDVAFIGRFVPFSELAKWYTTLSEEDVPSFEEERARLEQAGAESTPAGTEPSGLRVVAQTTAGSLVLAKSGGDSHAEAARTGDPPRMPPGTAATLRSQTVVATQG